MKLLCSVLLGTAFGQYADYGAYGYAQYSAYEYDQYGNKKNKNKNNQYVAPSGYGYDGKTYVDSTKTLDYFNGLHCWRCDARISADVDLGAAADGAGRNPFFDCLKNADSGVEACKGEARVCFTETRARYDRVYAVHAGCKSPDACVAMWRRNERFTLPFMLYGKHTTTTNPTYIDDECIMDYTGSIADRNKFEFHRSQWESVCRTCCVAGDSSTGTAVCNRAIGTPLSFGCGDGTAVAADDCGGATVAGASQKLAQAKYKYAALAAFMKEKLHGLDSSNAATDMYPMPVEGRNSVTEQKRLRKKDDGTTALTEQADRLSQETLDHFDIRQSK